MTTIGDILSDLQEAKTDVQENYLGVTDAMLNEDSYEFARLPDDLEVDFGDGVGSAQIMTAGIGFQLTAIFDDALTLGVDKANEAATKANRNNGQR